MSRLRARVDRLAKQHTQRLDGARCPLCSDWPDVRVVDIDVDGVETWRTPEEQARCPRCGWRPTVVEIVEVADWRAVRKRGFRYWRE